MAIHKFFTVVANNFLAIFRLVYLGRRVWITEEEGEHHQKK